MIKLKRGDKIYLNKNKTLESSVNTYLNCRDGVVECFEYINNSGYGSKERIFFCRNNKSESVSIIRQVELVSGEWSEEYMHFDSDSFEFLKALINGQKEASGGKYYLVRDY